MITGAERFRDETIDNQGLEGIPRGRGFREQRGWMIMQTLSCTADSGAKVGATAHRAYHKKVSLMAPPFPFQAKKSKLMLVIVLLSPKSWKTEASNAVS